MGLIDQPRSCDKLDQEDESRKLKSGSHSKGTFIFFFFLSDCGSLICQFVKIEGAAGKSQKHRTRRDEDDRKDFWTIKS